MEYDFSLQYILQGFVQFCLNDWNNRVSALTLRKLLPYPVDPAIRKFFFDTQPVLFLFYAAFYHTVLL